MERNSGTKWHPAFVILGVLFLLLGLLYAGVLYLAESQKNKWDTYKAKLESQGEIFDYEHFHGPRPPDEENLAMHPLFIDSWVEGSDNDIRLKGLNFSKLPGFSREAGRIRPDEAIIKDWSSWGDLPEHLTTDKERAQYLLNKHKDFFDELALIEEALQGRDKWWVALSQNPYERLAGSTEITIFSRLGKAFEYHALFNLACGNVDEVLHDLENAQRLRNYCLPASHALDFVVAMGIDIGWRNLTWALLKSDLCTDKQFQYLADINATNLNLYHQNLPRAFRGERAMFIEMMEYMRGNKGAFPFAPPAHKFIKLQLFEVPYFSHNCYLTASLLQEEILDPYLSNGKRIPYQCMEKFNERWSKLRQSPFLLLHGFTALGLPNLTGVIKKTYEVETKHRLCGLAIALERYRRKYNHYPGSLRELVPEFLKELPRDEINNLSINYRLQNDGTPLLYTYGEDGEDDGGQLSRNMGNEEGADISWFYTLPGR